MRACLYKDIITHSQQTRKIPHAHSQTFRDSEGTFPRARSPRTSGSLRLLKCDIRVILINMSFAPNIRAHSARAKPRVMCCPGQVVVRACLLHLKCADTAPLNSDSASPSQTKCILLVCVYCVCVCVWMRQFPVHIVLGGFACVCVMYGTAIQNAHARACAMKYLKCKV